MLQPGIASTDIDTFGSRVYAHRVQRGLAQMNVAASAGISAAYFSELENSKRPAPPRNTAWRIARALNLSPGEVEQLIELAERERYIALHEADLAPGVQSLLTTIRTCATALDDELVERLRQAIREACM